MLFEVLKDYSSSLVPLVRRAAKAVMVIYVLVFTVTPLWL